MNRPEAALHPSDPPVEAGLPQIEVSEVFEEPRRSESREPFPRTCCCADAAGHWHKLQACIRIDLASGPQLIEAEIHDCSIRGLSLVADVELRVGALIEVIGMQALQRRPLIVESFRVMNRRHYLPAGTGSSPDGNPVHRLQLDLQPAGPRSPILAQRKVYGLSLADGDASRFYKSYCDSILLQHLRASEAGHVGQMIAMLARRGSH